MMFMIYFSVVLIVYRVLWLLNDTILFKGDFNSGRNLEYFLQ